jgi:hypothetical protein
MSGEFLNEYSLSSQFDESRNITVSEEGTIKVYGDTERISGIAPGSGLSFYNNLTDDIEDRTSNFYSQVHARLNQAQGGTLKIIDSSVEYPKYGKTITYSKTFSNDPRVIYSGVAVTLGLAKVEVRTSVETAMPTTDEVMIAHRGDEGELVHRPNHVSVGSLTVTVTATKERTCNDHYLHNPPKLDGTDYVDAPNIIKNLLDKYALPALYKYPSQIKAELNEYWIEDLKYQFTSEGEITLTAVAKFTTDNIITKGAA